MSETMTAEQAASKLTNIMHDDHYSWHPSILEAFRMAVDALRGLPSAQPEQRWIPVTERLPNGFQTCIVTDELRQCSYEYDYNPDNEFTKRYGWRYNGRKIIAWMPLPEPWKEGEAE